MSQPVTLSHGEYKPGDKAPVSGIYVVTHAGHRPPHEVLIIRGEELPACRTCKLEVVFEVVRAVNHLTHDMDLAGPVYRSAPAGGRAA